MRNLFLLIFLFFTASMVAQDQVDLTVEVSIDGYTFLWGGPQDATSDPGNLHPDYGANFIIKGYIYPAGTFDANGSTSGIALGGGPEFPDLVIGTWRCQGWFIANAVAAFTNGGEYVITSQVFDIDHPDYGTGTLTTYGTEITDRNIQYNRTLTGGSGDFNGAVGQSTEKAVDFNITTGDNIVFTFDIKKKAAPAIKSTAPVIDSYVVPGTATQVGQSTLIRKNNGVSASFNTSSLQGDYAVTLWWVIFNNPEKCDGDCDALDLFNPEVQGDMRYASGQVTKTGNVTSFVANLEKGIVVGSAFPAFQNAIDETTGGTFPLTLPAGSGLLNPDKAEIHLVIRSHGPVIPGQVAEQIGSYEGGCSTYVDVIHFFDPNSNPIPDTTGECGDIQFSIHKQ